MKFFVIYIQQWFEELGEISHVKTFDTYLEASQYIEIEQLKETNQFLMRCDYVDKYLEKIEMPQSPVSPEKWQEFIGSYTELVGTLATPTSLKNGLRSRMVDPGYDKRCGELFDNFKPPILSRKASELHVLEVKE